MGGEFVMPPEVVQAALEEIYGSGADLQHLDLEEFEDEVEMEEVKGLERLRRQKEPGKSPGAGGAKAKVRWTSVPGIQSHLGGLPAEIRTGLHGDAGGSVAQKGYQDVWISGGSVRYDYEEKPW